MRQHPSVTGSLYVGDQIPERLFGPVTRTDFVRYAGASGDFNPIHHDDQFAVEAGFPTVFAMGMYPAGILASYITAYFGVETMRRYSVRFVQQVWPGDELTCSGSISAIEIGSSGLDLDVDLVCKRQTGGVAINGSAQLHIAV